jgi:hypothetical protein
MGVSRRALHALGASALALLALCGGAAAQRRPQATFSAIAEGTEAVSATRPGEGEGCPAGAGTETVRFTGQPFRIRIEDTGPLLEMSGLSRHGRDGRQPFTAAGTVARSAGGSYTCRLQTQPDCGTKQFGGLPMSLRGSSVRRGRLTLAVGLRAHEPPDVFAGCPALGGFPALFANGPPQEHVTAGALFDRSQRTLVLNASHEETTEALGGDSHAETSLKLTLRRL